jgi:hypothetical protein
LNQVDAPAHTPARIAAASSTNEGEDLKLGDRGGGSPGGGELVALVGRAPRRR